MKNIFLVVGAILLVGVGFLLGKNSNKDNKDIQTEVVSGEDYTPMLREIALDMSDYSFGKDEIRVRKGDTIKITFSNTGAGHSFVVNEFSINTNEIKNGESKTVEFLADKIGTFEYYSNIGDDRTLGMKGRLVID